MGAAAERNLLSRDSSRVVSSLQEPMNVCKRLGEREATFLTAFQRQLFDSSAWR